MKVQHIVWLKPRAGTDERVLDTLLTEIEGLAGSVPGVTGISVGRNFTDRAMGYSLGAIVTLRDRDALQPYLEHPEHRRVGALIREHCELLVMDFESD